LIKKAQNLIKKVVLKDGCILLDFSQLKNQQSSSDTMNLLHQFLNSAEIYNLRALSFSSLENNGMFVRNYLHLQKLDNLVILNLSSLFNIDVENDLSSINMLNLQCLNICNNQLRAINFSSHNFPKLKELYASNNKFSSAKPFVKLNTLKLLDVENNDISEYEEIVCLAFNPTLVVLNIRGNPFATHMEFE
jgi:Leucine-rich repeat (LRR) protein